LEQQTDEQLLEAHRTGVAGAMEVLIRRHHDDLLRFLLHLTGNRAIADDVFQEAFLQIHLSASTFDTSRRFKPWLFTIAANKARDVLRKNARRRTLDLDAPLGDGQGDGTFVDLLEIGESTPLQTLDAADRDAMVQRVVAEMPLLLREILLLGYFQKMSYNQIADALSIPLGTVKSRLHSAVAAFAKRWKAELEQQAKADGKGSRS
jgi:RNA polymerase sigma-70 factor, ECF subfamily